MKTVSTAVLLLGLAIPSPAAEPTHKFTWDNLLTASIKLQKFYDFGANVNSYMQRYQADTWNHVRNDEFEFAARRENSVEQFRQQVKDFSLDRNFVINTWVDFGNYNFETESFPILEMGDNYYWSKYVYTSGTFPRKFQLFLTNHGLLTSLPMSPQEARSFLQHRKDTRGNVNRRLNVKLYIRIVGLRRPTKHELLGEVQLARFYRNEKLNLVLHDFKKPEPPIVNEPVTSTVVVDSSDKTGKD